MHISNSIRAGLFTVFFVMAFSGESLARATEVTENGKVYSLPEVTVTAQKQEENIQQVPVATTAISGKQLEEARVNELRELSGKFPGLTINSSGGPGIFSFIGMRGRINSMADMDPTVTVLVDGVAYDEFFTIAAIPLFDVERVEVLRGPQSTLFGLNSQGGVINVITKKPGSEPAFTVGAELGTGRRVDGSWNVHASGSGPIFEDTLSGGIALIHSTKGDYIKNAYSGDRIAGNTNNGIRGTLAFTPNSHFDASATASYVKVDANNGYMTVPTTTEAAQTVGQNRRKKWETSINVAGDSEVESRTASLTMKYKAAKAELVSVSAFRDTRLRYNTDLDGTSYNGIHDAYGLSNMESKEHDDFTTVTQELRVQSPEKDTSPLKWLGGFFFHNFTRDRNVYAGSHYPKDFYPYTDAQLKGKSYAFFGQSTLRLFDERLGLTAGMRQEWTNRSLTDRIYLTNQDLEKDDSIFLPKFAVDYRITSDVMAYASVTKGWRPGGLYDSGYYSKSKSDIKYLRETSWTYEMGLKSSFFDNKLTVNMAAYLSKYKDFQDMYQVNLYETYLRNSGKAEMKGVEIEATALLTKNLSANLGFSYIHAEYTRYADALNDFSGNRIANVPDYTVNGSLTWYVTEHIYARPEVSVIGKAYWDRANEYKQDPYAVINMRIGYERENYEIYLFGSNLTNKYAFTYAGNMLGNDLMYGTPIRPLEVGLGFTARF